MSILCPLVLGLGLQFTQAAPPPPTPGDPARLQELLQDSQNAPLQSQAALRLVQDHRPEAEIIVRRRLRQGEAPEPFVALAAAIRLERDGRFTEELLNALSSGPAPVRQAAAESLAEIADAEIVRRLRALSADPQGERGVRQVAIGTLGRCGQRTAVEPLVELLAEDDETLRQAAGEALHELTGQDYGVQANRWRTWWQEQQSRSEESWYRDRLAYQSSRSRRLEGELERARSQVVSLHQLLYSRLPASDRLGHVQTLTNAADPAVRLLAIGWSLELFPAADAVGQRTLADGLLRLSQDGTVEVQRAAVLALARLSDPRAWDRLLLLVSRGPSAVRAAAARSLTQRAKEAGTEAATRQRQVVPVLQKALDDPALEVVVEAAEGLGTLGVPEASPVLVVLLRHPSRSVRQAAALALERIADASVLDGLLEALDDPAVSVRFSLVAALGHAASDPRLLKEAQKARLLAALEGLLLRDADPGVRSRAATVLGDCGGLPVLPVLWRRVLANEDARVQDKAWMAVIEIIIRSGALDLLLEWDRLLNDAKQAPRRLQLLTEAYARWPRTGGSKLPPVPIMEALIQVNLANGKWAAAFPLVRDLLAQPASPGEQDKRLEWLLAVGQQALRDDNRPEALRVVREAQPYLMRRPTLAKEFADLERLAQ